MRTSARLLRLFTFAFVLSASTAHAGAATGVTPSDATPVQREEAQAHFGKGRDLYTAHKYDDAAAEFEKSYAIVASPNALFFLARCDRERGKLVAAYAELGRTAAEAREHASEDPRYAKTAQAASDERDAVAALLGFVTLAVTGGNAETTISIAGAKLPRAALGEPLPVTPGSTEVVLETPGKPPIRQTISVFAGEKKTVTLDAGPGDAPAAEPAAPTPTPPSAEPSGGVATHAPLRTAAYVSAGVTVLGIGAFAVLGTLSNNAYSDLQAECHATACPAGSGHEDEINRGKTEQTLADVGLVVGLVGAVAAVTLFVMSLPSKSDKVSVAVGPTWMGVQGEF